jgi:translation elongation factor EF-1alpha
MSEQLVGKVTHYFGKAHVAAIQLTTGELTLGDTIHVKGHSSDFMQTVDSMQLEHAPVDYAKPGDNIGIRVHDHAREHDDIYRVVSG